MPLEFFVKELDKKTKILMTIHAIDPSLPVEIFESYKKYVHYFIVM